MRQHIKITSIDLSHLVVWGIPIWKVLANVRSYKRLPVIQVEELDFFYFVLLISEGAMIFYLVVFL